MKKEMKGEITIETAIVFTIILSVIGAMISVTLYAHDMVVIRSACYAALSEGASKEKEDCEKILQGTISRASTFVVKPQATLGEGLMEYSANVKYVTHLPMFGIGKFFNNTKGSETINVQKKISYNIMSGCKAVKDGISND